MSCAQSPGEQDPSSCVEASRTTTSLLTCTCRVAEHSPTARGPAAYLWLRSMQGLCLLLLRQAHPGEAVLIVEANQLRHAGQRHRKRHRRQRLSHAPAHARKTRELAAMAPLIITAQGPSPSCTRCMACLEPQHKGIEHCTVNGHVCDCGALACVSCETCQG